MKLKLKLIFIFAILIAFILHYIYPIISLEEFDNLDSLDDGDIFSS